MSNNENGARRRVVVTGVGLITPLGHNVPDTWAAILAGRSGFGPIT
ncbi:MAG TPA: beta-ketoacyl synthase N-terminal-like domain-containing protein, partial [Promineifilum sp.]|nr:beta-ketoacyl synthase N-terminal-like domain-containing protein [Promineifilum sp.]